MPRITITMSEKDKAFVDDLVQQQGLKSRGEYILSLIVAEQLKLNRHKIDLLLLEAIEDGQATPLTGQDWQDIEREGLEILAKEKRHARKNRQKSSGTPRSA
jgi:Arc/MetJ-type ribon-helix-helix transcriptional regulator